MEVNDQRDVAGKDVEDMTLEQLSEVCVQKFDSPEYQTMGKEFFKFIISKVVENGSEMEGMLSTNRESMSVLSLAAFFNHAIPAAGWQFEEKKEKTTMDLVHRTDGTTEHGILATMFGSFVRKVFEGHPQFDLIEEELNELLTIIKHNRRRISSEMSPAPKTPLHEANEGDDAPNYKSLEMLVEAPVVFPESEREAQTLPAANVARTSDACDADDVAETPPRRSGRNVGVKATYSDNSKRESKRRRTASKQESSTIDTSNIVEKPKKRRGRRPKTIAVPEEKEPEESAPINIRKDGQSGAIPQIPKASDDDIIPNDDETLVISEVDTLDSKGSSQNIEDRKIKYAGQTESKDGSDDSEIAFNEEEYFKLLLEELPADIGEEFKSLVARIGLTEAAAWLNQKISND